MTNLATYFFNGFALSAALIMAIGAQNMFVLRQGLRREHVGPIILFCGSADALLIAAGVAGLGTVLKLIPGLASLLTYGGAAFLAWYGMCALRRVTGTASLVVADRPPLSLAGALGGTAAFTLLNPHVYLDTVLLMGSVGASQPADGRPYFVVGAASASFIWFASLGYGAQLLAPLFARPMAWKVVDLVVGLTMLALAASLLAHGVGNAA